MNLAFSLRIRYVFLFITFLQTSSFGQSKIEWSPDGTLTIQDFLSPGTEIGKGSSIQIMNGSQIEFNYNMSYLQFMMTKNFNSKVNCVFYKNAALIVAPDTQYAASLVAFGQYCFNLGELYARRFRRELFLSKGVFSNSDFYKAAYEKVMADYGAKISLDSKISNFGSDKPALQKLNSEVLVEIQSLSEYCKTCKPKKKKD